MVRVLERELDWSTPPAVETIRRCAGFPSDTLFVGDMSLDFQAFQAVVALPIYVAYGFSTVAQAVWPGGAPS
ncbi:MAG: hypothetical protein VB071_03395 [Lawsonibacter sp.]|nr:hypothetical protein [Lawsonibacter sp.]